MMNLQELRQKVEGSVKDLVTLDVATFTGALEPQAAIDGDKISTKNIYQDLLGKVGNQARLIGFSHFELDGDAVNYVDNTLEEKDLHLLDAHRKLVTGAQESRKELYEFISRILGNVK